MELLGKNLIGKKAVAIPTGVTASVEGQTVKVKGPKGAMQFVVPDEITVAMVKDRLAEPDANFLRYHREEIFQS